jgi:hypothetical protein
LARGTDVAIKKKHFRKRLEMTDDFDSNCCYLGSNKGS